MAKKNASATGFAGETLEIRSGRLGPIERASIDIRPLTLFIGQQGTGKSLLAQVLYFFRGLPNLVPFFLGREPPDEEEPTSAKMIARRILDRLRSPRRSFANLTVPNVSVHWRGGLAVGTVHSQEYRLGFNAQHVTRQVNPTQAVSTLIDDLRDSRRRQPWTGVFVPTERLFYTLALGPSSLSFIGAPLILEVFSHWMELAGRVQEDWRDGEPDTSGGRWVRERLAEALRGQAVRRGERWRWMFQDGEEARTIELDMASSGQRANWPLSLIPQVLFSMKSNGELAEGFTLYVEEPEIHLHPAAERAIVEVLAYLVHSGFRVVLTTHSLTVLYAINNLLLAGRLAEDASVDEVQPSVRLTSAHVAAYHLRLDGEIEPLMDQESGLISEGALGSVADDLAAQMNRLYGAVHRAEARGD